MPSKGKFVDAVSGYLQEQAPETKRRLTQHYAPEVDEFSILMGKLIEILQTYWAQNSHRGPEDPRFVAFGLMTKGANALMAALESALSGYLWEPAALIRTAIESFATGWDITDDSSRFARWNAERSFESTKSLARLEAVVPQVGRLNGLLTDLGVHTKPFNSSPAMFVTQGGPTFQFFGLVPRGDEEARRTQVYLNIFAVFICLNVTELVFHQHAAALETIELIPEAGRARFVVSARHRALVDAMTAHFQRLADEKSG